MRTLTALLCGLFLTCNAFAAHRTFVAASGTDVGTCGPTNPCRTLDYAMSQTDSGGEVVITESGGYGSSPSGGITITKSISIIAQPGVFAALAPTTGYDGISINTAGIKVVIKGLAINGRGGSYGINMTNGTSLMIEKATISGFTSSGRGLRVQTAATVNVVDSVIRDNTIGITSGAGATVVVSGSQVINNSSEGVEIHTLVGATGATSTININDTVVSGSSYCVDNYEITGNTGVINATRVVATKCGRGFHNEPLGGGTMTINSSTASDNGIGFNSVSGTFVSLGNNTVYGNTTNVSGTITPAALR